MRHTLLKSAYGRYIVPVYFLVLLVVGCLILPSYGVGWDEDGQHQKGRIAYDYTHDYFGLEHDTLEPKVSFAAYDQRFYNMIFPLVATALSESIGVSSREPTTRASMLVWHYLLFGVCFVGFIAFYRLLYLRFGDWRWALLGLSLLLLTPRVSFHSFFNIKDSVMQAVVTIAALTFYRLLKQRTFSAALMHGAVCGLAIAVRPVGVILPALTLGFFALERINWRKEGKNIGWGGWLLRVTGYVVLVFIVTTTAWPFLWDAPLNNFFIAWKNFSAFPWSGELLFFSEKIRAERLPWYYIPGWIAVTVPFLVLIPFLASSWYVTKKSWRNILAGRCYNNARQASDLFNLALSIGSITAVIVLGSVLYDSWRHLYFIYPAMVYLATLMLYKSVVYTRLRSWEKVRNGLRAIIGFTLVYLFSWCIWMHPFQYNYFNLLAGSELEKRYEVDYWGVGYQTAIRWVLEHDDRERIRIYLPNYSGQANMRVLPPELKRRVITYGKMPENYDYFISNFRFPEVRKKFKAGEPPFHNPIHLFEYEFGRGVMIGIYGSGGKEE